MSNKLPNKAAKRKQVLPRSKYSWLEKKSRKSKDYVALFTIRAEPPHLKYGQKMNNCVQTTYVSITDIVISEYYYSK